MLCLSERSSRVAFPCQSVGKTICVEEMCTCSGGETRWREKKRGRGRDPSVSVRRGKNKWRCLEERYVCLQTFMTNRSPHLRIFSHSLGMSLRVVCFYTPASSLTPFELSCERYCPRYTRYYSGITPMEAGSSRWCLCVLFVSSDKMEVPLLGC